MLRTILVGLDGSADSDPAFELGLRWAKRFDALLVGLGVVDEPGLHGLEETLVGEGVFRDINRGLLAEMRSSTERSLQRCALRCSEAGVAFKELEDVGTPHDRIRLQAQRYDLVLLGRQTHFQFGFEGKPDYTLEKVLAAGPRPVVVVPKPLGEGESVVIAYDGSLQAARTLAMFQGSGLGRQRPVEVLTVDDDRLEAARCADRAVDYLRSHGIEAAAQPLDSSVSSASTSELILSRVRQPGVGLLVMGAYGKPFLHEFFLGSVTRSVLEESPVPIFLFH